VGAKREVSRVAIREPSAAIVAAAIESIGIVVWMDWSWWLSRGSALSEDLWVRWEKWFSCTAVRPLG